MTLQTIPLTGDREQAPRPAEVTTALMLEALACGRARCACHAPRRGVTHCPAHEDRSPSLGVTAKEGRLLVICRAGCAQADVIAALRARGLWGPATAARPRRELSPDEAARRDVLAKGRRDLRRLAEYHEAFDEADSLRIAYQTAARARHVATALGDSEAVWELLAQAATIEMEAMNAEAPDGRPW